MKKLISIGFLLFLFSFSACNLQNKDISGSFPPKTPELDSGDTTIDPAIGADPIKNPTDPIIPCPIDENSTPPPTEKMSQPTDSKTPMKKECTPTDDDQTLDTPPETTPPIITFGSFTSPTSDTSPTIPIGFQDADSGMKINSISIQFNGENYEKGDSEIEITGNDGDKNIAIEFTPENVPAGNYTIEVNGSDIALNTADPKNAPLVINASSTPVVTPPSEPTPIVTPPTPPVVVTPPANPIPTPVVDPLPPVVVPFTDIQGTPYQKQIENLYRKNLLTNTKKFRAEDLAIRGEVIAMVGRFLFTPQQRAECIAKTTNPQLFPDFNITLSENTPFASEVCVLKNAGLLDGFVKEGNNLFPYRHISVAEATKIATAFTEDVVTQTHSHWFLDYEAFADSKNAIPRTVNNVFAQVKRGEVAFIISQMIEPDQTLPSKTFEDFFTPTYLEKLKKEAEEEKR